MAVLTTSERVSGGWLIALVTLVDASEYSTCEECAVNDY